ncbi:MULTISPECIES: group II truncated hemoglobin [Pseudoalteromonas]|uniref:group II truncated hemoglobin n=1 Tax=Pseudoalteromonas TaxID=53246 RepID=UPI00211857A8|nr:MULTISPECIES: group II truncated hemoglobin [Pseudoalteromonas]MCQ8887613.1 group II truncated hemoglobin [Pseudoalteromonas agarivorans]MDC9565416.1 group II truncated hemoglobin [Pseudoalteromonas sp. GAB2316C]MDC9569797.1 group II truncated hemoglobin [Pseudoalteromonas sp. GABNB9D]MDC9573860.1 group II truncated hemoglobin [Pseudoalteromonas sp. GABNS16A]MDC9578265.1 group II truncated hemoglobin [Pseudoalteromonas sp. GABNS16E]
MIKRLFSKSKPAPEQPAPTPEKTPYEIIGGEAGTRAIANRFYDIMASDEYVKPLYDMHPLPLDRIRQVFFEFLSGWLGGPNLFTEKHGQPMLRKRHMPFTINKDLRDQWMYCMNKTLDIEVDNPLLREGLKQSFGQLATHMINEH